MLVELLVELGAAQAVGGVAVGAGGDRAGAIRDATGRRFGRGATRRGLPDLAIRPRTTLRALGSRGRRDGDGGRDRGGNGHFT